MGVLALLVLRSIVQHKQYREFVWSFQERIGPSNRMMAVSTKDPRGARWEKSAQNQMQRAPYAPLLRELWQLAAIGTWQACPAPVTFWPQVRHSPKYSSSSRRSISSSSCRVNASTFRLNRWIGGRRIWSHEFDPVLRIRIRLDPSDPDPTNGLSKSLLGRSVSANPYLAFSWQ